MVTMDSINYNVRIVYPTLMESFNIPQGSNAGKSLSYTDIDDIFGTEYGFTFDVQPVPGHEADFDAFFQAISAPIGYHEITMPHSQTTITFNAKVRSGSRRYYGEMGGLKRWKDLTVNFTPITPQRTA